MKKRGGNLIFRVRKIWIYDAKTLELVNGEAFKNMKQAGDCFKIDYRIIRYHLDTKSAISRDGLSIYIFSDELSADLKSELIRGASSKVSVAKHATS